MPTREAMADPAPPGTMRVSTVELFFELVFVFAITQLTELVELAHEPLEFLRVLLVLMLIWWMYAGYVWLTNVTGVNAQMRLVLIAAMAGFLIMGAAIPRVFGSDGIWFGLAYLFVILLHLVAFRLQGGPTFTRAVLGLAPFNIGAAVLVIAAGLIDTEWDWLFFLAAVTPFILATLSRRERGFAMNPEHFIDRHAGVMIIALGETVVGIGGGAAGHALDLPAVAAIVVALAFVASIWWSHFRRDEERAGQALAIASVEHRAALAVRAYWYPYIAMLFGIVLVATGVSRVVSNVDAPASESAWLLSGGMALYLLGSCLFRWLIGIRTVGVRVLGAGAFLALAAIGVALPSLAWLAAASALAVALLLVEERRDADTKAAPTQ